MKIIYKYLLRVLIFTLALSHKIAISQNIRIPISIHQEHLQEAVLPIGLPLDTNKLRDINGYNAVLISDAKEYPCSKLVLKKKYRNGSIKWLHTEIKTNNAIRNAKENYIELRRGSAPSIISKITVSENTSEIKVDNGVFTVTFNKQFPLPISINAKNGSSLSNDKSKTMELEDTIRGKSVLGGTASRLSWKILRQSEYRTVIFAEGYYHNGKEDVAKARVWYEIKEGMPFIDFNHTLINIYHNVAYRNLGFEMNLGNNGDIYVKDEEKQETVKRTKTGQTAKVKLLDNKIIDYYWKTIYNETPDHWFTGWNTNRPNEIKKLEKPMGNVMSAIGVARTHEMRIALNRDKSLNDDVNQKAYLIASPEYITKLNEHVWPVMATKAEGEKYFPNLERLITGFWSDYMLMDILVPTRGWYYYGRWNWPSHVVIRADRKNKSSPVLYGPHQNHIGSSQYGLHEHCFYAASRMNSREMMDYVLTSNRFVRDFRYCSHSGTYQQTGERSNRRERIEGSFLNGFNGETIFAFSANPNKPFSSGENSELISPLLIEYYLFDNTENERIISKYSEALVKFLNEKYPLNGSIQDKVKAVKLNFAGDGNEMNTLKAWIRAYELSEDKEILKYVDDLFFWIMDESGNWGASEKYWKAIAPDDKKGYNETYKAHMATNNGYTIFLVTEEAKYKDRIIKAWITEEGGMVYKDIKNDCLRNGHMQYQGRYPLAMSRVILANLSTKSVNWALGELRWYMNDFEKAAAVINDVRNKAGLDSPEGYKKRPGSAIFNVPTDQLKVATGNTYERYIYRCGSVAQTPLMLYALPVGMKVLIDNGR